MTPKQAKLLTYIARYQARNKGASPSVFECGLALGARSKGGTHGMLRRMQSLGLISRSPYRARSITIITNPTQGANGMIWGCTTCLTHRIGGRQTIESQEFHTLTVSSKQPKCRTCNNVMSPLKFDGTSPRQALKFAPYTNGHSPSL